MNKITLFLAIAFLTLGQTAAFGEGEGKAEGAEKEQTFTGCLQEGSEPNTYRLTNVSSEMEEQVEEVALIPKEGMNLDEHVGHEVQVTGKSAAGQEGSGTEAEGLAPAPDASEEGELQLEVTELQHISESCP